MKLGLYIAAATGDENFLKDARARDVESTVSPYNSEDLVGLTSYGDNIIHVAAQNGHLGFIKVALECFSQSSTKKKLIFGANDDGDTPLHLAASQHTSTIADHLVTCYNQLPHTADDDPSSSSSSSSSMNLKLWQIQNNNGNTALHLALMNGGKSIQVAAYLLQIGPEVASYLNNRNETPLHLAVDYDNQDAKKSMKNLICKLNRLGASLDYREYLFEEDSLAVIKLLLRTATNACCLRDKNGMTPLHRATLNRHLSAVEAIIDYCPVAIKRSDPMGRTILHCASWPNYFKLLRIPGISALIDQQDEHGNTPLHIAIMNSNYKMVQALIEFNANFALKNNEGISAATLILSDSYSFLNKMEDDISGSYIELLERVPKDIDEAFGSKNWEYLLRRLEKAESDIDLLPRHSKFPLGRNIIHEAVQHCEDDLEGKYIIHCTSNDEDTYSSFLEEFIVKALKKFPILSCQTDNQGFTPLFNAMTKAILKPGGIAFKTVVDHLWHLKHQPTFFPIPPWEAHECLLHAALMYHRYEFAEKLIQLEPKLVRNVTHKKETPLHLLCDNYGHSNAERDEVEVLRMVELLVSKDAEIVYFEDADGLYPLLRAVKSKRLKIAAKIISLQPNSIETYDTQYDRGVLHWMDLDPDDKEHREFCNILPRIKCLLTATDCKGNTPLHHAIEQGRFGTAQILMELIGNDSKSYKIGNNVGKNIYGMLEDAEEIPRQFQDFISANWVDMPFPLRATGSSIYGVRNLHVKDYLGAVGVVAALLTTITFTAAFTVPGGYDQEKGTPIMAKKVAYQVFMFTDVVAMCSSMMVLFCILWFLNSGQFRHEGSRLVDLSIALLELSFYSTVVAFMTGVYVTLLPDMRWLAIFTCVFCAIILLMMRRRIILDFVAPAFLFTWKFCPLICSTYLKRAVRKMRSKHQPNIYNAVI